MQARQQIDALMHETRALGDAKVASRAALTRFQQFIDHEVPDKAAEISSRLAYQQTRLSSVACRLGERLEAAKAEQQGHHAAITSLTTSTQALEDQLTEMQRTRRALEQTIADEVDTRARAVREAVRPVQESLDAALARNHAVEIELDLSKAMILSLRQVLPV